MGCRHPYNGAILRIGPTMFENADIRIEDLPELEAVDWQPMHASLRTQMLLVSSIVFGVIGGGLVGLSFIPGVVLLPFWIMFAIFATIAAPFLIWPFISVPKIGYALRNHDIAYKKGVIFYSVTTIPFDRIQHVETSRGPLDRRFGTSSLQLFTAGGSHGDLNIHGMDKDVAEHIRSFLLNRIDDDDG